MTSKDWLFIASLVSIGLAELSRLLVLMMCPPPTQEE